MKKTNGFTLAEVLITLSILGVVAAISIPNIIHNYQKRLTITKLQKAYANIEKMANNVAVSSGCIGQDLNCTGLFDISNSSQFANKFIELSGLKVSKKYNEYIGIKKLNYKNFDSSAVPEGTQIVLTPENIAYIIQKSGTKVYDKNAQYGIGSIKVIKIIVITEPKKMYDKTGNVRNYTQYTTDLVSGRNVFYFMIDDKFNVEPIFYSSIADWQPSKIDNNYAKPEHIDIYCNPNNASGSGFPCALRIIKDGWKITY